MMIKLKGMLKPVRFEDSGLEPLVVGSFLSGVMRRGHVSVQALSRKAGIPYEQLQEILENRTPADRKISKKLNRALPKLGPLLLRLQKDRDFFDKYGAVRPASPVRRANLVRRHNLRRHIQG